MEASWLGSPGLVALTAQQVGDKNGCREAERTCPKSSKKHQCWHEGHVHESQLPAEEEGECEGDDDRDETLYDDAAAFARHFTQLRRFVRQASRQNATLVLLPVEPAWLLRRKQ